MWSAVKWNDAVSEFGTGPESESELELVGRRQPEPAKKQGQQNKIRFMKLLAKGVVCAI